MTTLLDIDDLHVRFGDVAALRGVTFDLDAASSLAIVGESGAGKSTLALTILGLVQPPAAVGSVRIEGIDVLGATSESLRALRWETVALTMQGSPFNPTSTVGAQITEPMLDRGRRSRREAQQRAGELASEMALDAQLLDRFPHELSGGERRRASIAMALALDPKLLVLDEPTAGLDPKTRREVLDRIADLQLQRSVAVVIITHDLPAAMEVAERTMVLYAGRAVEAGASSLVMREPAHPYSASLLRAVPVMTTTKDLRPIRGTAPDPRAVPAGCAFHPRCSQVEDRCLTELPLLEPSRARLVACHLGGLREVLVADQVSKTFRSHGRSTVALHEASIQLREGEAVGVIGPSGSGKSTLARILAGHLAPDSGRVLLGGAALPATWRGRDAKVLRRKIQLVMQDPSDALSPRLTVAELVGEPLDIAAGASEAGHTDAVADALASVGLPTSGPFLGARTHELSGGQMQRIALARALVLRPKLLVADEPTAMLDASEQARLLGVLRERQIEMGLGLVLVSHDMALVRKVVDRIVVLDAGRVVEADLSERVSVTPTSTAARALVAAAPSFDQRSRSGSCHGSGLSDSHGAPRDDQR